MLARFSGQAVGSTLAKLQSLRYNGDIELLAEAQPVLQGRAVSGVGERKGKGSERERKAREKGSKSDDSSSTL